MANLIFCLKDSYSNFVQSYIEKQMWLSNHNQIFVPTQGEVISSIDKLHHKGEKEKVLIISSISYKKENGSIKYEKREYNDGFELIKKFLDLMSKKRRYQSMHTENNMTEVNFELWQIPHSIVVVLPYIREKEKEVFENLVWQYVAETNKGASKKYKESEFLENIEICNTTSPVGGIVEKVNEVLQPKTEKDTS